MTSVSFVFSFPFYFPFVLFFFDFPSVVHLVRNGVPLLLSSLPFDRHYSSPITHKYLMIEMVVSYMLFKSMCGYTGTHTQNTQFALEMPSFIHLMLIYMRSLCEYTRYSIPCILHNFDRNIRLSGFQDYHRILNGWHDTDFPIYFRNVYECAPHANILTGSVAIKLVRNRCLFGEFLLEKFINRINWAHH